MSLIWFDGFERITDLTKRGYGVVGSSYLTLGANNCRYPTCSSVYRSTTNATSYLTLPLRGNYAHVVIGLAIRIDLSTANGEPFLAVLANGNVQGHLTVTDSSRGGGYIQYFRPEGDPYEAVPWYLAQGSTSGTALRSAQWHYLEWEMLVSNTAGRSRVLIDGITVMDVTQDLYGRPLDSMAYSNGNMIDTIRIMPFTAATFNMEFDDLYVMNGGTFLGEVHARYLAPTGVGNTTQWSVTGAGSNWSAVSETTSNEPGDYIHSTGAVTDVYAFENTDTSFVTGGSVEVAAVAVRTHSLQAASVGSGVAHVLYDGTLHYAYPQFLGTTAWETTQTVYQTQPGGGAWTTGTVDSLQAGVQWSTIRQTPKLVTATAELYLTTKTLGVAASAILDTTTKTRRVTATAELFLSTNTRAVQANTLLYESLYTSVTADALLA